MGRYACRLSHGGPTCGLKNCTQTVIGLWLETPKVSRVQRSFDVCVAGGSCLLLAPFLLFMALLIRLTSKGPALFWSNRVGVNNSVFSMPKFRTMQTDAPVVATHLLRE